MIKSDSNKDIAIAIIFIVCIFFLWKFGILYSHSLFPVVKEGRLYIFIDWSGLMKISECYKYGVNVYLPNDCSITALIYGEFLRYIPFYKNLSSLCSCYAHVS